MKRVVNEKLDTITEYDLEKGHLVPAIAIREDAAPIDNKTKYAWADEDYEDVMMYVLNREEPEAGHSQEQRITELEAENKLLHSQVSALTAQNDFHEDLIVELANIVYA